MLKGTFYLRGEVDPFVVRAESITVAHRGVESSISHVTITKPRGMRTVWVNGQDVTAYCIEAIEER